jgi:hypothetical protein
MSRPGTIKEEAKGSRSPSIGNTSKMMKMLGLSQEDLDAKTKRRVRVKYISYENNVGITRKTFRFLSVFRILEY